MGIIARLFGLESQPPASNTISLSEVAQSPARTMPPDGRTRHFAIREALNGHVIEFHTHKYNNNGPDDFRNEVYVVPDGQSLVDAIATMLVITESKK